MIVGRGLLANGLNSIDNSSYLFYVNGVSNSLAVEMSETNFEKEELKNILQRHEEKLLVYFSTSQVNSKHNLSRTYVKHKLAIEEFIKEKFKKYLIIRTSNLVGYNPWNPHTLFNYLYNALLSNANITICPDVKRNFLDINHLVELVGIYINNYECNKTIEIVNPESFSMREVITAFETYYDRKFNITETKDINKFAFFELDPALTISLLKHCNLSMDHYIYSLLKKYY